MHYRQILKTVFFGSVFIILLDLIVIIVSVFRLSIVDFFPNFILSSIPSYEGVTKSQLIVFFFFEALLYAVFGAAAIIGIIWIYDDTVEVAVPYLYVAAALFGFIMGSVNIIRFYYGDMPLCLNLYPTDPWFTYSLYIGALQAVLATLSAIVGVIAFLDYCVT